MYQQQLYHPQPHRQASTTTAIAQMTSNASEIEQFRARQRMQFRQQQQQQQQQQQLFQQQLRLLGAFPSQGGGNQVDEDVEEDDDRVHKTSTKKHRQLRQQQQLHQLQRQQCFNSTLMTKLPNFGVQRRHEHHHFDAAMAMPSPVPHESHTMFNAFDYMNSPEAFSFADNNDSNSSDDQQMQNDDDQQEEDHDERSLWRRRFATDAEQQRRPPKLGQVALWESCAPGNNQFSHLHFGSHNSSQHPYHQQ